ncbi:MAG: glycosyltransferase family 39 protein [Phycisphaerae bacterium]
MAETGVISARGAASRVAIVLLAALAVRAYLLCVMPTISRDGVTFIWYAQRLGTTPLEEIRRQKQHPLYPALIAAVHAILDRAGAAAGDDVRSWLIAGHVVALTAGLAVIPAVYLLACVLLGRRAGVVAAACAAMLPELCRYGADVLSDSLHLFLYLLALAIGLTGVRNRSAWRFVLAGLLSGLAYLVRPEGGEVALVLVVAAVLVRSWRRQTRVALAAACVAGLLLTAGPYMLATGRIVQKKSIRRLIGIEAAAPRQYAPARAMGRPVDPAGMLASSAADGGHVVRGAWSLTCAAGKTLVNWVRSLRVAYLLPAVAWFLLRPRRPRPTAVWWIAAMAWCLHAVVCVLLIHTFDYRDLFSLRHVLVLAALTLPWTAAGLIRLVDLAAGNVRWLDRRVAWALAAVLLVGPTSPWLLRAPNREYVHLQQAGEWIASRYPRPQRILTDQWHVPFYARAEFCERQENGHTIRWPGTADAAALVEWVRRERPTIVVLDESRLLRRNPEFFRQLDALIGADGLLRLVHTIRADDSGQIRTARVYEVRL